MFIKKFQDESFQFIKGDTKLNLQSWIPMSWQSSYKDAKIMIEKWELWAGHVMTIKKIDLHSNELVLEMEV